MPSRHIASEMILGPPYHRHGKGPAGWSIKAYGGGGVPFQVERQNLWIDESHYVVVNAGQDYEFRTPSESTLFNFTIFLTETDLRDAWASHFCSEDDLLANAHTVSAGRPEFMPIRHRVSESISRLRSSLRTLWEADAISPEIVRAGMCTIVGEAVAAQAEVFVQTRKVAAVRRVTREETVRRIRRAVDYIEDNIRTPLDLDRLSAVACMAKHHFLRRFRDVIGLTPYQFVLKRRIAAAEHLLLKGDDCAADIGRACGFENPANFSAAFRAMTGMAPMAWRQSQLGNFSKARNGDKRLAPK